MRLVLNETEPPPAGTSIVSSAAALLVDPPLPPPVPGVAAGARVAADTGVDSGHSAAAAGSARRRPPSPQARPSRRSHPRRCLRPCHRPPYRRIHRRPTSHRLTSHRLKLRPSHLCPPFQPACLPSRSIAHRFRRQSHRCHLNRKRPALTPALPRPAEQSNENEGTNRIAAQTWGLQPEPIEKDSPVSCKFRSRAEPVQRSFDRNDGLR